MILDISEPSYYSKVHEIDLEVMNMCNQLKDYFVDREYSEVIKRFDVIPVVAPEEYLMSKPDINTLNMYSKSTGRISIFNKINYEEYCRGSSKDKKRLTIKCVVEASKMIKLKRGTKFDYEQFRADLLSFTGYTDMDMQSL